MIKGLKDKSVNSLKLTHYIILFIIIYISDDTFNFGTNENYAYLLAEYVVYLLLTLYLLSVTNLKFLTILTKSSLVFYLIVFFIIMTSFYNFDVSGGYIYQIWLFFLALLAVNFYSSKQFIYVYLKIVYILSFISLIIFIHI